MLSHKVSGYLRNALLFFKKYTVFVSVLTILDCTAPVSYLSITTHLDMQTDRQTDRFFHVR